MAVIIDLAVWIVWLLQAQLTMLTVKTFWVVITPILLASFFPWKISTVLFQALRVPWIILTVVIVGALRTIWEVAAPTSAAEGKLRTLLALLVTLRQLWINLTLAAMLPGVLVAVMPVVICLPRLHNDR